MIATTGIAINILQVISSFADADNLKDGVRFEPIGHGFVCLQCETFHTFKWNAMNCCKGKETPMKTKVTSMGTFVLGDRLPTAVDFHCGNCNKDKKSKTIGKLKKTDGSEINLCNGCYGELLAKAS